MECRAQRLVSSNARRVSGFDLRVDQAGCLQGVRCAQRAKLYEQHLGEGGSFTSSPIAADGKIYVTNEEGQTFVIKASPQFEIIARNQAGGIVLSMPSVSDRVLYIRTSEGLLAIAE